MNSTADHHSSLICIMICGSLERKPSLSKKSALTWVSLSQLNKELLTNIRVLPTVFLLETTQLVSEDRSISHVPLGRVDMMLSWSLWEWT